MAFEDIEHQRFKGVHHPFLKIRRGLAAGDLRLLAGNPRRKRRVGFEEADTLALPLAEEALGQPGYVDRFTVWVQHLERLAAPGEGRAEKLSGGRVDK